MGYKQDQGDLFVEYCMTCFFFHYNTENENGCKCFVNTFYFKPSFSLGPGSFAVGIKERVFPHGNVSLASYRLDKNFKNKNKYVIRLL